MTKEDERTVYLLQSGVKYLDEDGDKVADYGSAIHFNFEHEVEDFLREHPNIAAMQPRIVSREFTTTQMMSFIRAYSEHLRLKKK